MTPTISLIVPTIGRESLSQTLRSLNGQPWQSGDQVLIVGDGPQPRAREIVRAWGLLCEYVETPTRGNDWGDTPRNFAMTLATGTHLAFLDDDDAWTPDALEAIREGIATAPERPHLFRADYTRREGVGRVLWETREIAFGNVGTPMIVAPNQPGRLGRWGGCYGGDCEFIRETAALDPDGPVWHEEVICVVRPS